MIPDRYHSPFVPPFAAAVEERLSGEQTIKFEAGTCRLLSSTEPGLSAAKLSGLLSAVEAFDPDLVIAFGGSVTVADLLEGVRPLLCIPTTGQTISLADILLDFGSSKPPAGEGRLARSRRPFCLGPSLHRTGDSTTRADVSLPETAFVCIVVGNRLDAEVDGGFLDMLEQMLDRSPQALVLFAGGVDSLPGRLSGNRHAARRALSRPCRAHGSADVGL